MISAVLWPFLFLAGHEGDRLTATRTEGGRMQTLKHFSVFPDYLSSPSSFIRVHKFFLGTLIPPCILTLGSLGGHCNPVGLVAVQEKPPCPITAGSDQTEWKSLHTKGSEAHGAFSLARVWYK